MSETTRFDALVFRQNLGLRIEQCVKLIGKKSDAAAAAGVSTEQLNKWINGTVKVPVEALATLAKAADSDFSWLATGVGVPQHARPIQIRRARPPADYASEDDTSLLGQVSLTQSASDVSFVRLPFYHDVSASAGPGALAMSEQSDSVVAFTSRFLRDLGATPERCSVIRAKGDSMVPTIPDGALLVVDHSQAEISNGCLTVISVGDDLLVKRIRRRLDGLIDLVSDNQVYPPETIGNDRIQQLRIIGRVVYFCRTP